LTVVQLQSVSLNGKQLDNCWIEHRHIQDGSVLRFQLGPAPKKSWGTPGIPAAE